MWDNEPDVHYNHSCSKTGHLTKVRSFRGRLPLPHPHIQSITVFTWILYVGFCKWSSTFLPSSFHLPHSPPWPGISHPSKLKSLLSGPPKFTSSLPLIHSPYCSRSLSEECQSGPVTFLYEAFVTPQCHKILHTSSQDQSKTSPCDLVALTTESK